MTPKVFIDGAEGTTGLVIAGLLQPLIDSGEITLITINDKKSEAQRKAAYAEADLTVLCLPDAEAKAAIALMKGTQTRVLDASSAHRTTAGWVYGLPELAPTQPDQIRTAQYVSNPGCFATGAIALLRPLIDAGLLDKKECVTLFGVTGYSAGGKKAIARHEAATGESAFAQAFSAVSLNTPHKHVPEIKKYAGLETPPSLLTHVADVPRGMMISAVFNRQALKGGAKEVRAAYETAYPAASIIHVQPQDTTQRLDFSAFAALNAQGAKAAPIDTLDIHIHGWQDTTDGSGQVRVTALLDNLGKGAATQAVQNIRLMLGL